MKKIHLFLWILLSALMFGSCTEHFQVWKDINEEYLNQTTSSNNLQTSETGLRTKVFFQGIGPKPKSGSFVRIRYSAILSDGSKCSVIDTMGYVHNYPIGLQEALLQMNRESVWQICIPYDLGYGISGVLNSHGNYSIPPFSTIFVKSIELVEVY